MEENENNNNEEENKLPEDTQNEGDTEGLEESTIRISNDTVATYAGITIAEIPGVYGMSGTFAGITEAISGKKNYTKGVKTEITDKNVKIDLSIIVEYGARIPEIAFEIQTKVKKAVETMTGLKVTAVNVNIQGVHAVTKDGKEINNESSQEEG